VIVNGALASLIFIGASLSVDSYFWRYWLWPEGIVFWFNTVMNKSSNWGTSPPLWYFYSVLPRALLFTLFLVPFGLWHQSKKTFENFLLPSIGFVVLYSFLPHKELRFIVYVFPLLNAIAAKGLVDL
jgi:alpha-1,6-mannosyltransferase